MENCFKDLNNFIIIEENILVTTDHVWRITLYVVRVVFVVPTSTGVLRVSDNKTIKKESHIIYYYFMFAVRTSL